VSKPKPTSYQKVAIISAVVASFLENFFKMNFDEQARTTK
jgi:hypothetical protein